MADSFTGSRIFLRKNVLKGCHRSLGLRPPRPFPVCHFPWSSFPAGCPVIKLIIKGKKINNKKINTGNGNDPLF